MKQEVIGRSFEELQENEMLEIQGGAAATSASATTSWSSAPCTIGMLTVTVVSVIGATIYFTVKG